MPNKSINHSILKCYHSKDINEVINYYQKKQDRVFNKDPKDIGRGIKIGDLMGFNTNHNTDQHPQLRPAKQEIAEVNDQDQFTSSGHHELKPHFIFGQNTTQRKDAQEITQN